MIKKESFPVTTICLDGQGVMIMGKSGAGKSLLALTLIEQGAYLISDDVTYFTFKNKKMTAYPDLNLKGCMEVRGIGIVQGLPVLSGVDIAYAIILTEDPVERMPEKPCYISHKGILIPAFQFFKDEKYLPTLVKIAGKIIKKEVSLLQDE